jgi:RecQ mediated genome instability protein
MKMANGQLLFTPANIDILGGYVEALVAKWEVTRSLAGMKGGKQANIS